LKLEVRKHLSFEVSTSTLDHQIVSEHGVEVEGEETQVLVTAVANLLLQRHLRQMESVDLKPLVVDLLPVAVANAFWIWSDALPEDHENMIHVILHMSPDVCTLVVDGENAPFFNRNIYFTAYDVFGDANSNLTDREKKRRITILGDEVVRSLSFYEKTYSNSNFYGINLLGEYIDAPELTSMLQEKTGLGLEKLDLVQRCGSGVKAAPGKFDLAIALALRDDKI
jgi:Tfp pilus assembly PilM family ATPase